MSEAAASTATVFCTQCGRAFSVEDLMLFGTSYVCAECKPAFLQRVREGGGVAQNLRYASFGLRFVALLLDGVIGLVVGLLINIDFPRVNWCPIRRIPSRFLLVSRRFWTSYSESATTFSS